MKPEDQCVICGQSISLTADNPNLWNKGHNAQPIAEGQCCDSCNFLVIKKRLALMPEQEKGK